MWKIIIILLLLNVNGFAQTGSVEPKEPVPYGDPKLFDPFNNPDERDEPYIEDPDMTKMELPFKEPEILFDKELKGDVLERYYEQEPKEPPLFEPDLRFYDKMEKEPQPLIIVPDDRHLKGCPKGVKCN